MAALQAAFQVSVAPLAAPTVVVAALVWTRPAIRERGIGYLSTPLYFYPGTAFSVNATTATAVVAVADVGLGGVCVFLAANTLYMCYETQHYQQYGLRPSTITSICFSWHISMLGIFPTAWRVNVTCKTIFPVAMPD